MVAIYTQAILKLVYLDWRPVFLSDQIPSSLCEADYGKPSGHALTSTIMLPLSAFLIFNQVSGVKLVFMAITLCLFLFLICFSRLFFAKHSINQLVLGITFGSYLYYLIFYWGNEWLDKNFFNKLLTTKSNLIKADELDCELEDNNDEEGREQISDTVFVSQEASPVTSEENKKLLRAVTGVFLFSNLAMIIGFILARHFVEYPESHFFQQFKNCKHYKDIIDSSFSNKVIRDGGIFNVCFGLMLTHLVQNNPDNVFLALKLNFDGNLKLTFLRTLIFVLFLLFFPFSFLIGPYLKGITGAVVNCFFGLGIPLLTGCLIAGLYTKILRQLRIPFFQG